MRIVVSVLFLISLSCNQNDIDKTHVIKEYFEDTKHIVEYNYIVENEDTILNGKSTTRNQEGKVVAVGNYEYGKLDGKFTTYYNNGKKLSEQYFRLNKNYGESLFYYDNGHIKKYVLYNRNEDEVSLIVDFDRQGKYLSHEGSSIAGWFYYNYDLTDLRVGDTLKFGYKIADIPHVKRTLNVQLLEDKRECSLLGSLEPASINLAEKALREGKNTYKAKLTLEFNDLKRTIIEDSFELTFEIKKQENPDRSDISTQR